MKPPGEMTTHETGAKREDKTGKGRPDLISPIMLNRLAILMEEGAAAHGDRNWEKGMKLSSLLAPAFRHLIQTIDGCEDEDHPIQAIFGLMAYVHTLHLIRTGVLPPELDDLPREKNLQRIERSWKTKVSFTAQLQNSFEKNLTLPADPAIKEHGEKNWRWNPGDLVPRCPTCGLVPSKEWYLFQRNLNLFTPQCSRCGGQFNDPS